MKPVLVTVVALAALTGRVAASLGDRLLEFRECVDACEQANCRTSEGPVIRELPSAFPLVIHVD